jgi:predicted O-methyltransferase YrrM
LDGRAPYPELESPHSRYWLNNKFFPYADGMFLQAIMRHFQPRRIVEVGSGFSSAACLDANDQFFGGQIHCTFVDPHPERLNRLLSRSSGSQATVLAEAVQDVPVEVFLSLHENDILLLDSSHVAKVGSDVNHLFGEILPILAPGVLIHFHDIFFPFEYPEKWIKNGWAWNEAYMLRAFLQFNDSFRIIAWPDYLERFHQAALHRSLPHCDRTSGSIWIQKIK